MNKIKIALQKAGRLHEESINFLKACGFKFSLDLKKLKVSTDTFDVFFLRDDDIPMYVQEGIADVGIVGRNVIYEQEKDFLIRESLGIGCCRLSFAVPKLSLYKAAKDLSGKCIATSHPKILEKFLKEQAINASINKIKLSGSVEIAPNIGIADAICDLVSSGSTLDSNDLKELETIFYSEAVFICHPESSFLAEKLLFRIQAVKKARNNKYLLFNAPNKKLDKIISGIDKSCKILPLLPIADSSWSYVQVIIPNNIIWSVLDELKKNSAKNFVVLPIKNIVIEE